MTEPNKLNFLLSDQGIDRKDDIFAMNEFGKIVNRYSFSDQIYSDDFWIYLKKTFNIKKENILTFCDLYSDVKNRVGKMYKYVIRMDKPNKILFVFLDEEKVDDPTVDKDDNDEKNKISELSIYFDTDASKYIETKVINEIQKLAYNPEIGKTFFIISTSTYGYELRPAMVKDIEVDLNLNYGDDFVEKHNDILSKLKNNKHGLFLLHGPPGTGKTSYIRRLVSELAEEKTIIYVPSYFMWEIANPELISFISKFKNSILLLEDAEGILTSPQEERSQAVTNILNISDGLLNDHMDMQIIATFNIDKNIIDDALLRKGRMMVNYKFKKLNSEQATKLSAHIGLNKKYTSPATLAEIYEEKLGKQLIDSDEGYRKKVGFNQK